MQLQVLLCLWIINRRRRSAGSLLSILPATFVLESAIKNRYDQAAWCLITYDIYAIDTVMGWYIEYPDHMFVDENDTYTCEELLAVLDECIDKF